MSLHTFSRKVSILRNSKGCCWASQVLQRNFYDGCYLLENMGLGFCREGCVRWIHHATNYRHTQLSYSVIHTVRRWMCSRTATQKTYSTVKLDTKFISSTNHRNMRSFSNFMKTKDLADENDRSTITSDHLQKPKIENKVSTQQLNEDIEDFCTEEENSEEVEYVEPTQEGLLDEEIEDFYRQDRDEEDEEVPEWIPPVSLTRGKTGVFDIDELVKVLESENAIDICVIKIPPEIQLTDHMVIVSAKSRRHMKAIMSSISLIYKQKKHDSDPWLAISGFKADIPDWMAVDVGNAFLHVMMPEIREKYDLETLWTVGEEFDDASGLLTEETEFGLGTDLDWIKELNINMTDVVKSKKKKHK